MLRAAEHAENAGNVADHIQHSNMTHAMPRMTEVWNSDTIPSVYAFQCLAQVQVGVVTPRCS